MPAYVIADVRQALDQEALVEYRRGNTEAVIRHGGRFVVRGGEMELLEGEWDTRRIVMMEFPDMAAARGWYESDDYAPLKALPVGVGHEHHPRRRRLTRGGTVRAEWRPPSGPRPAFVFPARRGRMRLALTPTRLVATSAAGTVELPWKARSRTASCRAVGRRPTRHRRDPARGRGVDARRWLDGSTGAPPPRGLVQGCAFASEAGTIVRAIERYRRDARRRRSIGERARAQRGARDGRARLRASCWSDGTKSALGSGA